eukprot:Nk52_evm1s1816 gene=Nk52_evmTU1s1816
MSGHAADEAKAKKVITDDPNVLEEFTGQYPPPSKTFVQVLINKAGVVYREWHISLRNEKSRPTESVCKLKEFHEEEYFWEDIEKVFGKEKLEYMINLAKRNS